MKLRRNIARSVPMMVVIVGAAPFIVSDPKVHGTHLGSLRLVTPPPSPPATPARSESSKQIAERVVLYTAGEGATFEAEIESASIAPPALRLYPIGLLPVVAVPVVLLALVGVRQDGVCLVDPLEAGLGLLVSGIDVRVKLPSRPPKGLLYLFFARVSGDA